MFRPDFPLANLRPAPYNPRRISPEAAETLRESLATLGHLKAIIVAPDGLLLAGHQRTTQNANSGRTTAPAIVLESAVNPNDQARFNQLHNASDLDFAAPCVQVPALKLGWHWVDPRTVQGHFQGYGSEKANMLTLLAKYGPWGNAVCDTSGRVLVGGLYALCCALLRVPLLVRVVRPDAAPLIAKYFGRSYGEFCYDNIDRTTWVQSMAQKARLRREDTSGKGKSRTYENLVIPRIEPGARVLDFGAGQMDYVKKLQAQGVDIRGVEFYYRGRGLAIDTEAVHRHIDALCDEMSTRGRFDLVVCDSVLNSVDTQQAEADVLTSLSALCKPGGRVIWSGRPRGDRNLVSGEHVQKRTSGKTHTAFFDDNGLTALSRGNRWQFQKFHTTQEVCNQARQYVGDDYAVYCSTGRLRATPDQMSECTRTGWGAVATKTRALGASECESALSHEFDLSLPDGSSYGRGSDIVSAWRAALSHE